MELIKVTQNADGQSVVSARELYAFLGYDTVNWARWYPKNIVKNPYAVENEDWVGFFIMKNGNETKDFALSLDFAKRLAMRAQTDRGEQAS
jgi:phage anti-repressor protein